MIGLIQNETIYEYDIRSLILAFFIGEKIELTDSVSSIYDFILEVFYEKEKVTLRLYEKENFLDKEEILGDYKNKKIFKNPIKRAVYHLFSKASRKKLPWGTLTGIRPTKIVFDGYEHGKTNLEIMEEFQKVYLASKEKASLCTEVVSKEQMLLSRFPYKEGYSLYVGIPFCPTTCMYCSFASYPIEKFKDQVGEYLKALLLELDFVKKRFSKKKLQTIYIGGGTPTALPEKELAYLLDELNQRFPFKDLLEVTVEAGRPDSLSQEKFQILARYGVTRISINPQTMNDKTLHLIGREHSVKDVREKFFMAREAGLDNINMDTICGLPEEGMDELKRTYEEIKKLDPDSLTVHALAVKRSSKFNQIKELFHYGATPQMISYAHACARSMEMEPYYLYRQKNIPGNLENVGFSKKKKECLYNILIMEELHDIIAVGAGTSSKIMHQEKNSFQRVENLKDIFQYTQRIEEMIHRKELAIDGK